MSSCPTYNGVCPVHFSTPWVKDYPGFILLPRGREEEEEEEGADAHSQTPQYSNKPVLDTNPPENEQQMREGRVVPHLTTSFRSLQGTEPLGRLFGYTFRQHTKNGLYLLIGAANCLFLICNHERQTLDRYLDLGENYVEEPYNIDIEKPYD